MRYLFQLALLLILLCSQVQAQFSPWTAFPQRVAISAIAEDATHLYLGFTNGGLGIVDKLTSAQTNYDRSNSPLQGNRIQTLLVDSNDKLWIGTLNGLATLDNGTWQSWEKGQMGFPSEKVYAIAEASNGDIWVGTADGLALQNGNNWTVYTTQNSTITSNQIYSIAADGGNIWLGTAGLTHYDGSTFTNWNGFNSNIPFGAVSHLLIDNSGDPRMLIPGEGLVRFDGNSFSVLNSANSGLFSNSNAALVVEANGTFWTGSSYFSTPLQSFDGSNWTNYTSANSNLTSLRIQTLHTSSPNHLWVGTQDGLFERSNGTFNLKPTRTGGFFSVDTETIAFDSSQNLWVGTITDGIFKYDGASWIQYDTSNSPLPHNQVFDIEVGSNGDIWMVTHKHLVQFDGTNWTLHVRPGSGGSTPKLLQDGNGAMWIARSYPTGVERFAQGNWTVFDTSNTPMVYDRYFDMVKGSNGSIYLAGLDLMHFDGTNWTPTPVPNASLAGPFPQSMVRKGDGIWLGNWNTVQYFDGVAWTIYDSSNTGIPFNSVRHLTIDRQGHIWGGQVDGTVFRFDGSQWTFFDKDSPYFPWNGVRTVFTEATPDGKIWFCHKQGMNGIFNYDPNIVLGQAPDLLQTEGDIKIYPNPASQQCQVKCWLPGVADLTVSVFDTKGNRIARRSIEDEQRDLHTVRFATGAWPAGLYFVVVDAPHQQITAKLLVRP